MHDRQNFTGHTISRRIAKTNRKGKIQIARPKQYDLKLMLMTLSDQQKMTNSMVR